MSCASNPRVPTRSPSGSPCPKGATRFQSCGKSSKRKSLTAPPSGANSARMRGRIWIFAALVAAALALHLVVLSAKAAQTGEDNIRAHLALSTSALRAQLGLLDARLAPRAVGTVPDLIEATRPPVDPVQPLSRPDERALRAAASALQPEPDLLAVVNGLGAIVSRPAKPAP